LAAELSIKPVYVTGNVAELARQVADRTVDAFWFGSGLPTPAFAELEKSAEVTIFGLDEAERAAMRKRFPFFAPYRIPAKTYTSQPTALETVAVWNFVIAHKDVPDDTAYAIVKAVLENTDKMRAAYAAAAATRTENAASNTFLPFHSGALRFYREKGAALPPETTR
jgi:TRAP transporter TAXI family solute receptor